MAGFLDLSTLKIPGLNGLPMQQPDPTQSAAPAGPVPQGGVLDGLFAPKAPHQMTGQDRLNVIGATLRDMGAGLRGDKADALAGTQKTISAEGGSGAGQAAGAKKVAGSAYSTADLYKVAQSLFPGDPKAQFLWTTQNTDFLKDQSSQYAFHDVAGGNTILNGGAGAPSIAPKLVDHGGQYGTQGADGYTGTGAADPSYADQTAWTNSQIEADKAKEAARHNGVEEGQGQQHLGIEGGQLGVARQHLGFDQQGLALNQRKFGHESNPTAPIVYTPDDYAKLPSGQHTQYVAPDGSLRIKP
jgi:hypothetical protein